jgi:hypothetical protein
MEKEPTNKDVVNLIDGLAISMVTGLETLRLEMTKGFTDVRSEMNKEFGNVRSEMAVGFENTVSKQDFANLQIDVTAIQADLRSFKEDTEQNFKTVHEDIEGLSETIMFFDKRIEILEDKVLA